MTVGGVLIGWVAFDLGTWVWMVISIGLAGGVGGLAVWMWFGDRMAGGAAILVILLFGIVFRLLILSSDGYLSDDIFRYHFDGRVLNAGINPYRYAPDDKEVSHLRIEALDQKINHPHVRTVYPPLAQVYFALAAWVTPSGLGGLQALFLLSEIMAWLLLWWELRRRGSAASNIMIMAWAPLLMLEGYLPGHLDMLALPWTVLLLIWIESPRPNLAAVALTAACLIKPIVMIFVPMIVARVGLRKSLRPALLCAFLLVIAYLPFISAGKYVVDSMWLMAAKWFFNASVYTVLESIFTPPVARLAAGGLLVGLIVIIPIYIKELHAGMLMTFGAFVVCTTTLFPWYLIWMFPILVVKPDPALLVLSVLVLIAEMVNIEHQLHDVWYLPHWVQLVEYVPFFVLLVIGSIRKWGMFSSRHATFAKLEQNEV